MPDNICDLESQSDNLEKIPSASTEDSSAQDYIYPDDVVLRVAELENGMSISAGGPPVREYIYPDKLLLRVAELENGMSFSAGGPPVREFIEARTKKESCDELTAPPDVEEPA